MRVDLQYTSECDIYVYYHPLTGHSKFLVVDTSILLGGGGERGVLGGRLGWAYVCMYVCLWRGGRAGEGRIREEVGRQVSKNMRNKLFTHTSAYTHLYSTFEVFTNQAI